jgi:xylulose-5-phosphate/fructose-6-phosphate phosphoketolase
MYANKKADIVRLYCRRTPTPPVRRRPLPTQQKYINVVVASKHARPQWLDMESAVKHCTQGHRDLAVASNDQGAEPDVVMACCGETPTLESWRPYPFCGNICPT